MPTNSAIERVASEFGGVEPSRGAFSACEKTVGHSSWVLTVEFSPDCKHLFSSGADAKVRWWPGSDSLQGRMKQ